jgi:hypothetical protein
VYAVSKVPRPERAGIDPLSPQANLMSYDLRSIQSKALWWESIAFLAAVIPPGMLVFASKHLCDGSSAVWNGLLDGKPSCDRECQTLSRLSKGSPSRKGATVGSSYLLLPRRVQVKLS